MTASSWLHGNTATEWTMPCSESQQLSVRYLERKRYKMPGDYLWEFDANAFIQRLTEETGIAHTWKPVRIRLAEGDRTLA